MKGTVAPPSLSASVPATCGGRRPRSLATSSISLVCCISYYRTLSLYKRRCLLMSDNVVNPIQVQKFLGGIDYPASKDQVVQTARQKGADQAVLHTLERLPAGRFHSPNDVSEAVGKLR